MKVALYLRVSSDKQAEEGNSVEIQEKLCRRWARANGHKVVAVFKDEGISGVKDATERPGLMDALLMLRDGGARGLVMRDLDRLARSVTVQEGVLAEVWSKPENAVFTATSGEVLRDDPDDPMRTAMREMVGVFAGLDRRMIVKRLRDGRKAKAAKGGHAVGPAPYGWTAEHGQLLPHPGEQAALKRMLALHSKGKSTRQIAQILADESVPTKRGGSWSSPVVARILARHIKVRAA